MPELCTSQKSECSKWFIVALHRIMFFVFCFFSLVPFDFSYLRWQETGREEGISIAWESITLHAISSEPVKCIYIMLDVHIDYPPSQGNGRFHANNGNDEQMAQDGEIDEDDDDEGTCEGKTSDTFLVCPILTYLLISTDEEPRMTEIWYTPHDENRIEEIFEAMKHCQSLHPDPNGKFSGLFFSPLWFLM